MLNRLFAALSLSFSIAAMAPLASAGNAFAGQWPLLPEGVSAAADEVWGELPNGLRYVIVPTDSASEAVSLRLMVAAGRAQEEKGKAGVAALLADLSNYGTSSVNRDQLMGFKLANGMDPHSRTSSEVDLHHTVYRLDLEEPERGAVEAAVDLLNGIASAPLFDAAAFAEAKARMEYASGLGGAVYEPKGLLSERVFLRSSQYSKMSDAEIHAAIPSIELGDVEAFWSRWYKADRMLVVATGVLDSTALEAAITEKFSGLEASPELVPFARGDDRFRSTGDIESEDSPSTLAGLWITHMVEVGSLFDRSAELDYYTLDFIGRVAQSYATGSERLPNSIVEVWGDYAAVSVNRRGQVMSLLEQLLDADKAVHRLAEHGVLEEDLALAKEEYLNLRYSYDLEVSEKEWAPLVADRIVRCVVDQIPFRYGASLSEFVQTVVSRVTFESVRERSAELFREKDLSYYLELPEGVPLGTKMISKRLKTMRKSYDFTWEQAGDKDKNWDFGAGFQSGGMVESTEIIQFEEYPVLKYEFANSLRMNLVRSEAFQGRVQMIVSFGNGTSELENPNPAFEAMVRRLMLGTKIGSGVEAAAMSEILDANGIENLDAGVTKDHLFWSGIGRDAEDVEEFLSTVLVWLITGEFSKDDFDDELEKLEQLVDNSFEKNSSVRLDALLNAEDARLRSYFDKDEVEALDFESLRQWMLSVRENAYIEVTVVGDVLPRTVLRDVRKTFGSLPNRTGKVMQPRHGKPVKWNEPGISRDTFKMGGKLGNITLFFPQVGEKSCASDRVNSVFLPLFEEHLKRALADRPSLAGKIAIESIGYQMVPLSNAIKLSVFCTQDEAEEAEALLLEAANSFEASLTEDLLVSAERSALIGLKRIARSQASLINLFKQSQGKPKTLGCVLDLLENGYGLSFEEYKEIAKRQFSAENVRGVVLMPAE